MREPVKFYGYAAKGNAVGILLLSMGQRKLPTNPDWTGEIVPTMREAERIVEMRNRQIADAHQSGRS